jgi:peptide/nickel transport system permease protein
MAVERAAGRPELPLPKSSPANKALRAFRTSSVFALAKPLGALGGLLVLLLVLTALFAPALAPYDPVQIQAADRLQPPNLRHPLERFSS